MRFLLLCGPPYKCGDKSGASQVPQNFVIPSLSKDLKAVLPNAASRGIRKLLPRHPPAIGAL